MMSSREGLSVARFMMVLSSISPLFIFWALRGNSLVPDLYFIGACALMVVLPNLFLYLRISSSKRLREVRSLYVARAEDHRDHLLVYLFAMLLPFYAADFGSWRDFASNIVAVTFIVFIFWHLNLHYMNIVFAAFGYHVFTIYPVQDGNAWSGKTSNVLISKRVLVPEGKEIKAYRLSNTVYLEMAGN